MKLIGGLLLASIALRSSCGSNTSDSDPSGSLPSGGGEPLPPDGSRACSQVVLGCGCWGFHDGSRQPARACVSGFAEPRICAGFCPLGGSPYATVRTCESSANPVDAGNPVDPGPRPGPTCSTLRGGSAPSGLPAVACGSPGPTTTSILQDVNTFWQSRMSPCACDQSGCLFNAWVLPQTPGYIYYRRDFLEWISQAAGGSTIGAAWMLSHEAGHNLQLAWGLRYSSPKAQELGADCLSGYFLAWLQCNGRSNMSDMLATTYSICAASDSRPSSWFDAAHGTCPERQAAVQRGALGYQNGAPPTLNCAF
jgi:hypothetical protein